MTSTSSKGNLCLIPARGNSRRIPRKNLRLLAGKPLVSYSIELAQRSGLFEQIVVSSEDPEILSLAEQSGVTGDLRPSPLAEDRAQVVSVVEEYLRRAPEHWQRVAVLQPAAPFRSCGDLLGAWEILLRTGGCVVSVCLYETSPALAMTVLEGGRIILGDPARYSGSLQSQLLPPAWHPNGALYLFEVASFLARPSLFGPPLSAWTMPRERSLDLDEPFQWPLAEAMMQGLSPLDR